MSDESSPKQQLDPRTYFAAERTFLAWIRTGLALMGFGFVVSRFNVFLRELRLANSPVVRQGSGSALWLGVALVTLGVVVNVSAALRHMHLVRILRTGGPFPENPSRLGLAVAALVAAVGVAMAVYLVLVQH